MILDINKVDRPDARIDEVVRMVEDLFLDLDADEDQLDFPIVYTDAKRGWASLDPAVPGDSLKPLFDLLLEYVPAPTHDPEHPLQAMVTNLDASPYLGRLAICRVRHGVITKGEKIAWCRADGTIQSAQVSELFITEALDRVPVDEAGPGEIIAVAGLDEVTIGETLADADDPRPLPVMTSTSRRSRSSSASTPRRSPAARATRSPPARSRTAWIARRSATSRSASGTPSAPTPGRSRAAASCSWPSSSRSCAARASS